MRKILFIASLMYCFSIGLWADSFHDLSIKYPVSMLGNSKITSYCAIEYLLVNASNLSSQELQTNSTSGWKKAGIYGAEFVEGLIGSFPPLGYAYLYWAYKSTYDYIAAAIITIGDALLVGPLTWVTGKAFKQEGSLRKAIVGAGIGGLIGSLLLFIPSDSEPIIVMKMVGLSLAPLGAVIGNNL